MLSLCNTFLLLFSDPFLSPCLVKCHKGKAFPLCVAVYIFAIFRCPVRVCLFSIMFLFFAVFSSTSSLAALNCHLNQVFIVCTHRVCLSLEKGKGRASELSFVYLKCTHTHSPGFITLSLLLLLLLMTVVQ